MVTIGRSGVVNSACALKISGAPPVLPAGRTMFHDPRDHPPIRHGITVAESHKGE
jgi:hypothetical protein